MDVAGQDDNLGDTVLRRGLLDALRESSVELHIHTGDNSNSYVAGLNLHDSDTRYSSRSAWRTSLLRTVARGRTGLAIDPGEIRSDAEMNFAGPRVLLAALAVRARGGAVIHSGIGLRATREPRDAGTRLLARLSSVTTWRDAPSRERGGVGKVAPDWAFLTRPDVPLSQERPVAAVTMRGDRPLPDERWLQLVRDVIESSGLTPVVYSQVRRDNDVARWLADRLPNSQFEPWPEEVDHAQWEVRVREILSNAKFVVSDRVHALIVGATEGAVPLGLARTDPEKLTRTLEGAGIVGYTFSAREPGLTAERLTEVIATAPDLHSSVREARDKLLALQGRIRDSLDDK